MIIYGTQNLTSRTQAKILLALAAREEWGLASLPEIGRLPGGKPFFPSQPQLHFNLSHSGSYALCALDTSPVGVDIQVVKPWRESLLRQIGRAHV